MRNLPTPLKAHLAEEVTTLATCWRIERADGLVMGFTDHDQALTVNNEQYDSIAGFTPSSIASNSEMAVDNLDLSGHTYPSKITAKDLLAGLYDMARLEVFSVNYNAPDSGKLIQKSGIIGEITLNKNMFCAEVRGNTQLLSQTMCQAYTPHCRAQLGDKQCGFDLKTIGYTAESAITKIIDNQTFLTDNLDQHHGWFKDGYLIWNSGENTGIRMEIKEFSKFTVTLALPMPFIMQVGDNFTIFAGCDKSSATCLDKFKNIINFRGEPDLIGSDKMMQTVATRNG